MSMMINVHDREDESAERRIMYNDTMNRKWKDAMKAHGILKALQHTQNTEKSITFTHFTGDVPIQGKLMDTSSESCNPVKVHRNDL